MYVECRRRDRRRERRGLVVCVEPIGAIDIEEPGLAPLTGPRDELSSAQVQQRLPTFGGRVALGMPSAARGRGWARGACTAQYTHTTHTTPHHTTPHHTTPHH
eukprot:7418611-Pyramimonas_sp.AAC.1